jgi:hypothetical protein
VPTQSVESAGDTVNGEHDGHEPPSRYRLSWAEALRKVFEIEIAVCPRCRQKGLQQIAIIKDERVLRAMLASIERTTGPP